MPLLRHFPAPAIFRAGREYNKTAGSAEAVPRRKSGDSMFFSFRPCPRRVRRQKRRVSPEAVRALAALGCLALLVALLLIAPQWVLVVIILALSALLIVSSRE